MCRNAFTTVEPLAEHLQISVRFAIEMQHEAVFAIIDGCDFGVGLSATQGESWKCCLVLPQILPRSSVRISIGSGSVTVKVKM